MIRFFLCAIIFFMAACDGFEYSPNQVFDDSSPRKLNDANIAELLSRPVDDTVTVAYVGDSQRFYDEVDIFVHKLNEFQDVDFVFLAGDITDFGLLNEYKWINKSFSKLKVPYIAAIGNHDVIGNGEKVFTKMFGPLDFAFVYDSIKFVVHNTNSREFYQEQVPDLEWLEGELKGEQPSTVKYFVGVSHVPPYHGDFNAELTEPYSKLLASTPGFLVSLHAHTHDHSDGYPFNDGVRYITSFAFEQRSFLMLKFYNGSLQKQIVNY